MNRIAKLKRLSDIQFVHLGTDPRHSYSYVLSQDGQMHRAYEWGGAGRAPSEGE